jgi:hypothetical protein
LGRPGQSAELASLYVQLAANEEENRVTTEDTEKKRFLCVLLLRGGQDSLNVSTDPSDLGKRKLATEHTEGNRKGEKK